MAAVTKASTEPEARSDAAVLMRKSCQVNAMSFFQLENFELHCVGYTIPLDLRK